MKYERQGSPESSISGTERDSDSHSSRVNLALPDDVIELESNPLHWTREEVYQYLMKTEDCSQVAQKCKDEVRNKKYSLFETCF